MENKQDNNYKRYSWCEHNKNITGTYTPCLMCDNSIGDSNEASDATRNSGALTPLGEALQTPCPRCNKRWIIHDCPTETLNNPSVAESGCEHEWKFSHKEVEARGVQAIFQTVIYVICPKCGLVKFQV